ncbi:glycosyltransferase family 4 protein [Cobetia sp. UIB-001]|uniref:glycosyltransferase family 4 protein n=1 Tax=Cobetia sp. UIB-001 TaxID=2717697 RepID=UPI003850D08A
MMDNKPVILIFAANNIAKDGITGAAIGTEIVINSMQDTHKIETITLRTNGLSQLSKEGIRAKFCSLLSATFISFEALFNLVKRGLKKPKVDIFYMLPAASTFGILRNLITVLLVRIFYRKVRIVYHIRNGNYFEEKANILNHITQYVNKCADRIIVLSRLLLPDNKIKNSLDDDCIFILPNTIDSEIISKSTNSTDKLQKPWPIKVLYLSNFIEDKGYLTLLEAGKILVENGLAEEFIFTFHGKWLSSQDRITFESQAEFLTDNGLDVHVGGSISSRADVQSLYAQNHVFCLPTSYAAEAQPRSILEAMSNECVVVSTRFRSIPDMVIHEETGLLIDYRSPKLLADALSSLTPEEIKRMSQAGLKHFEQEFSPSAVKLQLLEALKFT